MEECIICSETYNLYERRPIILDCEARHRLCKLCVEFLYTKSGQMITCPVDFTVCYGDLKDYEEDTSIINKLLHYSVDCTKCFKKTALYVNLSNSETVCIDCKNNRDVFSQEIVAFFKKKFFSLYEKSKQSISFEMKVLLKQALDSSLIDLIRSTNILSSLFTYSRYCKNHKTCPATRLSLRDFTLICDSCSTNNSITFNDCLIQFRSFLESPLCPKKEIHGLAPFLASRNQTDIAAGVIEAYLMVNNNPKPLSARSCMGCHRSFQVGLRMPYELNCGHFLCRTCIRKSVPCPIDQTESKYSVPYFDQSLYEYPKCKICNSYDMGTENLPYHHICNCIVCQRCIGQNQCNCDFYNCTFLRTEKSLKVYKRALNSIKYLKFYVECSNCRIEWAFYLIVDFCLVLCFNCLRLLEDEDARNSTKNIQLDCSAAFDKTLYEKFGWMIEDPGFSLKRKLWIISSYSDCCLFRTINSLNYEVKDLYRFDHVFPVCPEDNRKFIATSGSYYNVELKTNINVKLFGIILAGKIKNKSMLPQKHQREVRIQVYDEYYQVKVEEDHATQGKFNFISFSHQVIGRFFKIMVWFYENGYYYCGKALQRHQNKLSKDKVSFEFMDSTYQHSQYKGPILGILYSL